MSYLDSFRTSSPTRQILTVAAAAALLCLVLIAAYFLLIRRPYDVLFANLRTTDAATIVSALDKKKIPYRLDDGGATILVPRDLVDSTRLDIANEDLPIKGMVGFELFDKSDMGLTEFAQRINYQRALQGELARTIMTMDTVDTARVHLSLAEPSIFRDDRQPSKASVTVIARRGATLAGDTVRGIQRLVAAAVPNLVTEDVVVLDEDGKVLSGDVTDAAPASPLGQEKQAIEQYYASRLRQGLSTAFPGNADVAVAARSDPNPASIDADDAALNAWTPSTRAFPLTVTVSFPTPPSPEVQDQVKRLAAQVIGLDSAKGDVLVLATSAPVSDDAVAPPPPVVAPSSPMERVNAAPAGLSAASAFWLTWLVPLLLILGFIAFLLHRGRPGPRRLTEQQRNDIAQRLQTLLDKGDGSVAQPV